MNILLNVILPVASARTVGVVRISINGVDFETAAQSFVYYDDGALLVDFVPKHCSPYKCERFH